MIRKSSLIIVATAVIEICGPTLLFAKGAATPKKPSKASLAREEIAKQTWECPDGSKLEFNTDVLPTEVDGRNSHGVITFFKGCLKFANGRKFQHGDTKVYFADGKLASTGSWLNGQKEGIHETLFANGKLQHRVNFRNGKLHGKELFCHDDGTREGERDYDSGIRTSMRVSKKGEPCE